MTSSASTAASRELIGFIGLGAMGAPMARRLASLGYPLVVHDLNAAAVQSVVSEGASAAESIGEIARKARLVFTCLPSLEALDAVVFGPGGLAEGDAMQVLVDFSTTGANFARQMAQRLTSRGKMFVDSPITGNVVTAGNGKLGIMCSGPQGAFELAQPAMRDLASAAVLYLGETNGRAQRLKLLNNLLSATGMASACEAFVLGVKGGLDPEVMLEIINAGEASSSATRNKFPKSVLPRKFDFGARMAITAKDTSLTVKEAEELGVPMWIGQAVQQIWKYAVSQGGGDQDGTSLITFLEPWAGVEVRSGARAIDHVVPAPAISGAAELVVVCSAENADALASRLDRRGWRVASGQDAVAAGQEPKCRVLGVPADADLDAMLGDAGPGRRIVVNARLGSTGAAQRLCASLLARGDGYVDLVPTGTAQDVENDACSMLAGGPAVRHAQVRRLLEDIAEKVFVVSQRPGDAHLMQIINGSLSSTLLAVTSEAYVAGAKAGLDALTMVKILGIETGRNAASSRILPEQVATRKFVHGKKIADAVRELSLLSDEARRLGVTSWVLEKARLLYMLAAQLGRADDDITRIATHYEKWAGTQVRAFMQATA